jgi:hypothetical protein
MPRSTKNSGSQSRRRPDRSQVPAGAPPWITAELLQATLETWQPHYEKPLTSEDALEILLNVDHFLAVLEDSGNDQKEVRRSGPRLKP